MERLGILDLMLPAFCECLVLVGIHSYLGLHVIRRKVIFVDLALAQVAALGTTAGFLFGMAPDSVAAFIFSVWFTFMAAAVFSVARLKNDKVPQEAVIGLIYAIAAAVVVLVIDRAPHGAEHIKEVMTGAILWVSWESVIFAAVVYALIGVVHVVFAKKFMLISDNPEEAFRRGMRVRLWDFLFYLTFGIVISVSVRTAGVLLVFVFLVVPAITATLITDRLGWQLIIGWIMGVVVTVLGLGISYWADLPSGPAVVAFYGVMLVLAAVAIYLAHRRTVGALLRVLAGAGVVAAALAVVLLGGRALGGSSLASSRSHGHQDSEAPEQETSNPETESRQVDELLDALGRADGQEQNRLVDALGAAGPQTLESAFETAPDDGLKLIVARQAVRVLGPPVGGALLLRLVREAEFPFVRSEAAQSLDRLAHRRFGYSAEASRESNQAALEAMERWLGGADPTSRGEGV